MLDSELDLELDGQGQEPPLKKPKRFQCQHCQRFFARLEHLQRHERTRESTVPLLFGSELTVFVIPDTREKPFACTQCDSKFTRRHVTSAVIHNQAWFQLTPIQVIYWSATRD